MMYILYNQRYYLPSLLCAYDLFISVIHFSANPAIFEVLYIFNQLILYKCEHSVNILRTILPLYDFSKSYNFKTQDHA